MNFNCWFDYRRRRLARPMFTVYVEKDKRKDFFHSSQKQKGRQTKYPFSSSLKDKNFPHLLLLHLFIL